MPVEIKNKEKLVKLLWWDFSLGFSCGLAGLILYSFVAEICGLPESHILFISAITLLYSFMSFYLAYNPKRPPLWVYYLVLANWAWCAFSLILLTFHVFSAEVLGIILIVGQIAVVGTLAYLEGKQIQKMKA